MTAARREATPRPVAAPADPMPATPAAASPSAAPAADPFLAPALQAAARARERSARIRAMREQHAQAMAARPSLAELPPAIEAGTIEAGAAVESRPSVSWELETPQHDFLPLAGRREGGAYRTEYQPHGMVAALSIVAPPAISSVSRPLIAWRPRANERWVVKEKAVTAFLAKSGPAFTPARELPELVLATTSAAPADPAPTTPSPGRAAASPPTPARSPFGPGVPLPTVPPPAPSYGTLPGLATSRSRPTLSRPAEPELVLSDRADWADRPLPTAPIRTAMSTKPATSPRPTQPAATPPPGEAEPLLSLAESVIVPRLRMRPAAAEPIADLAPSFATVPVTPAPAAAVPLIPPTGEPPSTPLPAAGPSAKAATAAAPPKASQPPTTGRFAKTVAAAEQLRGATAGDAEPWSHVVPQPAGRVAEPRRRLLPPQSPPAGQS